MTREEADGYHRHKPLDLVAWHVGDRGHGLRWPIVMIPPGATTRPPAHAEASSVTGAPPVSA